MNFRDRVCGILMSNKVSTITKVYAIANEFEQNNHVMSEQLSSLWYAILELKEENRVQILNELVHINEFMKTEDFDI